VSSRAAAEPNVALSHDGEFVAAGTWDTSLVKVWDTDSGKLVKELESGMGTHVAFSSDGRLFAACSRQALRLWEIAAWRPIATFSHTRAGVATGCVAFAPKSGLLAAAYPNRMIQLIDTGSLQRVAILEAPDRVMLRSLKFGSDGTKLAAATEGNFIHIWDLRRLRERLREMSLDWEAPPFHPGKSPSPKPIQVNIVSRHEASQ
jgi:WD40 repeat protein